MIDNSDRSDWARCDVAQEFIEKVKNQRGKAFRSLLKDGDKKHNQNAETYKAFDVILRMIDDFSKMT